MTRCWGVIVLLVFKFLGSFVVKKKKKKERKEDEGKKEQPASNLSKIKGCHGVLVHVGV